MRSGYESIATGDQPMPHRHQPVNTGYEPERWRPQSLAGVVRSRIPEFSMGSGRLVFRAHRARDCAIHPETGAADTRGVDTRSSPTTQIIRDVGIRGFVPRAPRRRPQSLAGVVRSCIPAFPMGSGRLVFRAHRARDCAIHPGDGRRRYKWRRHEVEPYSPDNSGRWHRE